MENTNTADFKAQQLLGKRQRQIPGENRILMQCTLHMQVPYSLSPSLRYSLCSNATEPDSDNKLFMLIQCSLSVSMTWVQPGSQQVHMTPEAPYPSRKTYLIRKHIIIIISSSISIYILVYLFIHYANLQSEIGRFLVKSASFFLQSHLAIQQGNKIFLPVYYFLYLFLWWNIYVLWLTFSYI